MPLGAMPPPAQPPHPFARMHPACMHPTHAQPCTPTPTHHNPPANHTRTRRRLRRWLAGTAAATAASTAAALAGLLPAGVASAIDGLGPYDAALDPLDAELLDASTPELMEVMFIVVATYFGLMVLYLWLASIIDEVSRGPNMLCPDPGTQCPYVAL